LPNRAEFEVVMPKTEEITPKVEPKIEEPIIKSERKKGAKDGKDLLLVF
jgi:hypothetical protein